MRKRHRWFSLEFLLQEEPLPGNGRGCNCDAWCNRRAQGKARFWGGPGGGEHKEKPGSHKDKPGSHEEEPCSHKGKTVSTRKAGSIRGETHSTRKRNVDIANMSPEATAFLPLWILQPDDA